MSQILDQFGRPIDRAVLKTPQTADVAALENKYLTPMLAGLTPARLTQALTRADEGDLVSQHRLFADMEERDAHLACEINKRKLSVMSLDWDIVPPPGATRAEKANAAWAREVLTDAVDPLEDLLLALMDGVGHGFSPVEQGWRQEGRDLLPCWHPRPQEWLRMDRLRRELRLDDASAEGAPLRPFGWVLHTHGKAKTGYLGRMGLHRATAVPFLYKAFGLGDFAEFLETYGLPFVVGKYFQGATPEERASLRRAVTALGHDARAIMPAEMALEIQKVAAEGSGTPHLAMVDWADRAQSKAVLGQTTSSEARATGLGSGVAEAHAEVRRDIRAADARQIAGTVTRDVVYPLLALNKGGVDSLARCPRLVFDTGEPEDIKSLAEGLEKLTAAGMRSIPVKWVHEKLRIPEPADGEETLGAAEPPPGKGTEGGGAAKGEGAADQKAALAALRGNAAEPDALDELTDAMASDWEPVLDPLVSPIEQAARDAASLEEFRAALPGLIERMDTEALADLLARGQFAAHLLGRASEPDDAGPA